MDIATGLAAASAALTTVKHLAELDKALSQAELKLTLAGLKSDLADVRMALTDAKETIADLEGRVRSLNDWEDEKRLYTLTDAGNGVMVYRFDSAEQEIPAHDLCPTCWNHGRKSILQPEQHAAYRAEHLVCNTCKLDVITRGHKR
ncbi:hypothetical protein [Brevundimonas diminuta]|uniref:hypothetical protein n=1 Tax=Brevundimonas diminuta TaxID=293 RepID=UPI00320966DF